MTLIQLARVTLKSQIFCSSSSWYATTHKAFFSNYRYHPPNVHSSLKFLQKQFFDRTNVRNSVPMEVGNGRILKAIELSFKYFSDSIREQIQSLLVLNDLIRLVNQSPMTLRQRREKALYFDPLRPAQECDAVLIQHVT